MSMPIARTERSQRNSNTNERQKRTRERTKQSVARAFSCRLVARVRVSRHLLVYSGSCAWFCVQVLLCVRCVTVRVCDKNPAVAGARGRRLRACQRRYGVSLDSQMRWWCAWLLAAACALLGAAPARGAYTEKVCSAISIRGRLGVVTLPSAIDRIRGCTVIEGSLSLVLLERSESRHWQNYTFPELREITGYLMLYRVRGLRSLGQLFPNLAVIRGQLLIKDFALVVINCDDLQTLGLSSLTTIERGAVRIEKNSKLCYVDSVNWAAIAAQSENNNVIRDNNYPPQCGLCKGEADTSGSMPQCPKNQFGQHLCWDSNTCQKVCPQECGNRACMANGTCCDVNCLGSCTGPRPEDCHVCRHFSIDGPRRCLGVCPGGTFKHYNRRCVTEKACREMPPPEPDPVMVKRPADTTLATNMIANVSYKPFNDSCVFDCPAGYVEGKDPSGKALCRRCEGVCIRYCSYDRIDSLEAAQKFRGCTHLTGSLDLSIRGGGNMMEELEECLGMIQSIEGQLKISRSFAFVTLSFFKSLKRIGGKTGGTSSGPRQSLYVFDNPNLEHLWDWKQHGNINIESGKLFIHFNPKLCFDQIEPLKKMARESTFDDLEVSRQSNGDKAACNHEELKINVQQITAVAVVLSWPQYCLPDQRQLLGYSVYYTKAKDNVTLYEKRNACQDTWMVEDLSNEALGANDTTIDPTADRDNGISKLIKAASCKNMQPVFHLLPRLEPYTRYAAYVKTYTTQADIKGAQSPIVYFTTLPGQPKPPLILNLDPIGPNEMLLKWQQPFAPNGNITLYHVLVEYEEVQEDKNDYCVKGPPPQAHMRTMAEEAERQRRRNGDKQREADGGTCACDSGKPASLFSDARQAEQIESSQFEDDLQNMVYIKSNKKIHQKNTTLRFPNRLKRTTDLSQAYKKDDENTKPPEVENRTSTNGYFIYMSLARPANTTEVTINKLRHFASYKVSVWACRERHHDEIRDILPNCSQPAVMFMRTPKLEGADAVTKVKAEMMSGNKSTAVVRVTWEAPAEPNGPVWLYNIRHSRVENDNIMQSATTCVSRQEYDALGRAFLLRNLAAGNYSITVTAHTFAGLGPVSDKAVVFIPERSSEVSTEVIAGVVIGCASVVCAVAGYMYWRRRMQPTIDNNKMFASVNPEYVGTVYVPDEWEVPRANIDLVRELGQGSFGMVYEGIARDLTKDQPETKCAVKTVNEHATDRERADFLNEASVMKAFDTFHVVRLLGVVSRGQPTLVIMELMERGDLKSYLRSHRPDQDNSIPNQTPPDPQMQPPSMQQIKQMAIEIADGMSYLAAKKFVHRDLAARNCMVAGDLTVKVGDFGMTRDIYETDYYRKGSKGLLPVRWMSPESLKDGVFSSASDVWSFGVVLWEMATLAMQPYQGLSNEQVLRYVVEGGLMERPERCPDGLYDLMRRCWAHRPSMRPDFMQIVSELAPASAPHFRHRSFFHSPAGQEYFAQHQNQEDEEQVEMQVGALTADSGSNLFGVSGRLASWVRELSSLRSHSNDDDAAAEPLAPHSSLALKPATSGPNGVVTQARYSRDPSQHASDC